jgi:EF-P beta-lysylation protein EpmB
MIPASSKARQPAAPSWQQELAQAITDPSELLTVLGLDPALLGAARAAAASFRLRVPLSYVARMRHGDATDPLLRQVLPLAQELEEHPGFSSDPLAEQAAVRAPGLLHKYHGRALLITTPACAVHCRYCFRREFPYAEHGEAPRWQEALAQIEADSSLEEIILSGGDPLSLSDARLQALSAALERVPHVRRLRLHTRLPVVLPARVDAGLLDWLAGLRLPAVMVLHANHANEIDAGVQAACARLRTAGVVLLNQSVLLRGVNDHAQCLRELSQRLFAAGVLPYYLHLLDRVRGTAHFEVGEARARELAAELAATLPGYLVPRLARELAGAPAKLVLAPNFPP